MALFDNLNDGLLAKYGVAAIYTPAGGSAKPIRVCLTLGAEDLSLGGQMMPQAIDGQAGCKASDVVGVKMKDTLKVDDVTYGILKGIPDETGWMILYLGKSYA